MNTGLMGSTLTIFPICNDIFLPFAAYGNSA